MLLDPGPLGLHSAIAAIIWKPSIDAIAEPFLSAITAMLAIIWKAGFRPPFQGSGGGCHDSIFGCQL